MTKLGRDLIQAADEALAFARGELNPSTYRLHIPDEIDVKAIRDSFELSQSNFAARFAIPEPTLRDWEQHRRKPSGMARLFLLLLAREPAAVRRLLSSLIKPAAPQSPRPVHASDDDDAVAMHAGVLMRPRLKGHAGVMRASKGFGPAMMSATKSPGPYRAAKGVKKRTAVKSVKRIAHKKMKI